MEDAAVSEEETQDEDERERAEMKRLEKDMEQAETQEQKDYKAEFFELLDEVKKSMNTKGNFAHIESWLLVCFQVLFLLGKTRGTDGGGIKRRRSLRDTSLRFHRRGSHGNDQLTVNKRDERSRSICVPSMATLTTDPQYGPVGGARSKPSSRKSSWSLGMETQ